MKKFLTLLIFSSSLLFACNKPASTSLEGAWKMVMVTDRATNTSITKPSYIQKDVIIFFDPNNSTTGRFTGQTPTNTIHENSYSLGANQSISIPSLSMTKVAETSWGAEFADNIPEARRYSFPSRGKLKIETEHKTLTFQKL